MQCTYHVFELTYIKRQYKYCLNIQHIFARSTPKKTLNSYKINTRYSKKVSTENFWSAAQLMNPKKLKSEQWYLNTNDFQNKKGFFFEIKQIAKKLSRNT